MFSCQKIIETIYIDRLLYSKMADEQLQTEKPHRGPDKKTVLAITLILIAATAAYGYFFIISPTFVEKGTITKPSLSQGEDVKEDHVKWVVNEIGGYKLHKSLSGEDPEMEIVVEGKKFTVKTVDNEPVTTPGAAQNPDIRIIASLPVFYQMYDTDNIQQTVIGLYNSGDIQIELLKDEATLALKGYKAIYDEIQ
jgi:hypothetical protein